MKEIYGNIHSIESCGTVDGPGVRMVIFFQGCPMRCQYCHNPDMLDFNVNNRMSVDEILDKYEGVKQFLKNGGITASGGEPLAQIEFLTELFKESKSRNIHTALDTSGILFNIDSHKEIDKLMKYTDLVLLDIKHIDSAEHNKLTGHTNENAIDFALYLNHKKIPVWIRHVVVPGITYSKNYLTKLGEFLCTLDNIQALDVLPYHNMAISKYAALGKEYKLKNTLPLTREQAVDARNIILSVMKEKKLELLNEEIN